MTDTPENLSPPKSNSPKKRKGCFAFGCLGSIGLIVVIGVYVYLNFDSFVDKGLDIFTATEPLNIETLREQRINELEHRRTQEYANALQPNNETTTSGVAINALTGAQSSSTDLSANTASPNTPNLSDAADSNILEMDEEEFNEFIAISPEFADIKDNVYLLVEGDTLYADVSYPLDEFADAFEGLRGRHFNGRVSLYMKMLDEGLELRVTGAQAQGETIPQAFLDKLSKYNIAEKYNKDPAARKLLQSIKSIDIVNGKVKLVFK